MDLLIKNANIITGDGKEPVHKADILVQDGIIRRIGVNLSASCRIVDVDSAYVCPAFIDAHRHLDWAVLRDAGFGQLERGQGIGTAFGGLCGMSGAYTSRDWADYISPCLGPCPQELLDLTFSDYLDLLENRELPLDLAFFVGMGSVTSSIKGMAGGRWSTDELRKAQDILSASLEAGAMGISAGIMYEPERFNSTGEYVRILSAASGRHRPFVVHLRSEGDSLVEAVEEACEIAGKADLPLVISHFKVFGRNNWQRTLEKAVRVIEKRREEGQDVCADFYPYSCGSTTMLTLIPPVCQKSSLHDTVEFLDSGEGRRLFCNQILREQEHWDNMVQSIGWHRVILSSAVSELARPYVGRDFQSIADSLGEDPANIFIDMLVAEKGRAGVIVHSMSDSDVDTVAALPWTALISDSLYSVTGNPHPRLYGSFVHFLCDFVFRRGVLTLEEAVWKMTGLVADRYGLSDKGLVREGLRADLLSFRKEDLEDRATYDDPCQEPAGLRWLSTSGKGKLLYPGDNR